MAEIPRQNHFIFSDTFDLPGGDLTTRWDNSDLAFTNDSEKYLEALGQGEYIYDDTSLHTLIDNPSTSNANFSITVGTFGTDDLRFTIRARRQNATNYIGLTIDFILDRIQLVTRSGANETLIASEVHNFKADMVRRYVIELRMFDNSLYGIINGFPAVTASSSLLTTEPGFSLYVPEIDILDPPKFYLIKTNITGATATPQLETTGNLLLDFRKNIKAEIENPDTRTWTTFQKAQKFYDWYKDLGRTDEEWTRLGYPIRKPSPEEWFGQT